LQILSLSQNQLKQIPLELGRLANLQRLDLDGNLSLLTPPPEILAQGTRAVLSFLRELSRKHLLRYEAKLILVGEAGTGKSSLIRTFYDKAFDTSIKTTHALRSIP
jgi:internalin A